MNTEPKIIFLAWVSWSGKTTMMQLLLQDSRFEKVCSTTTRKPRPGEVSGDQYIFISTSEFEDLIAQHKMLEYAFVHQIAYYGTRSDLLQVALDHGKRPIKTIDMIGMEVIEEKKKLPDGQYICLFLDVDEETMKARILSRQPDMNDIELHHRLDSAEMEKKIAQRLSHCIIIDASGSIEEVYNKIIESL